MPVRIVFCVVCGAPLIEAGESPQWMTQLRTLYTAREQWHNARVSKIGKRHDFKDMIPLDDSIDEHVSAAWIDESWVQMFLMRDTWEGELPGRPRRTSLPLWGYALHSHCWEILSAAFPGSNIAEAVQALFDLFRSQHMFLGSMKWGHDYGGLIEHVHKVHVARLSLGEDPTLWMEQLTGSAYLSDPLHIPKLELLLAANNLVLRDDGQEYREAKLAVNDPFLTLPSEIITEILVELDSTDVCRLRLASRTIADAELPDRFWRSRFWLGREFSHIFEVGQSSVASNRHRALYAGCKALQKNEGMTNRKRVWRLACRISELAQLRLRSLPCYGSLSRTPNETDAHRDKRQWCIAEGLLSTTSRTLLNSGSRALCEGTVNLTDQIYGIVVFLVCFDDKRYVSGLRLLQRGSNSESLGYCHSHETYVCCEELIGFQVAVDARGIRGISVQSASRPSSAWLGDHQGVAKKLLMFPPRGQNSQNPSWAIKGGFDALKLVSLSVTNGEETKGTRSQKHRHDPVDLRTSSLWYPEVPDADLRLLGSRNFDIYSCHVPYTLVLFGGSDGSLLPYLKRITVWTTNQPFSRWPSPAKHTHLWGIEFQYSNGQDSMVLGQPPPAPGPDDHYHPQAHHVTIDSDAGERLTRVEAMYETPNFVSGLRLHTSQTRAVTIPPSLMSKVAEVPEDEPVVKRLDPGDGTIVGMYTSLKHDAFFQFLGIASKML